MADDLGTDGVVVQDFGGHMRVVRQKKYAAGRATVEDELGSIQQWVHQGQAVGWEARYWDRPTEQFYAPVIQKFTNKQDALSWLLVMIRMQ